MMGGGNIGPESMALQKEANRKAKADKDAKKKLKAAGMPFGKLIENDQGTGIGKLFYRAINRSYNVAMQLHWLGGKILWSGSCIAFMWACPIMYELFNEQQKIMMQIQMSHMADAMGGAGGGGGGPRPF